MAPLLEIARTDVQVFAAYLRNVRAERIFERASDSWTGLFCFDGEPGDAAKNVLPKVQNESARRNWKQIDIIRKHFWVSADGRL